MEQKERKYHFRRKFNQVSTTIESFITSFDIDKTQKRSLVHRLNKFNEASANFVQAIQDGALSQEKITELEEKWDLFKSKVGIIIKEQNFKTKMPQEIKDAQDIISEAVDNAKKQLNTKTDEDTSNINPTSSNIDDHPKKITQITQISNEIDASKDRTKEIYKKIEELTQKLENSKKEQSIDIKQLLIREKNELQMNYDNIQMQIDEMNFMTQDIVQKNETNLLKLQMQEDEIYSQLADYSQQIAPDKAEQLTLERTLFAFKTELRNQQKEKQQIERILNKSTSNFQQLSERFSLSKQQADDKTNELNGLIKASNKMQLDIDRLKGDSGQKKSKLQIALEKRNDLREEVHHLKSRYNDIMKNIIPDLQYRIKRTSNEVGHLARYNKQNELEYNNLYYQCVSEKLKVLYPI